MQIKQILFEILVLGFIFASTVYFRSSLLKYFGFFEPDDFYHYSVIRAAVANHFIIPLYLSISGWPAHTIISEPAGLYYLVLVPYFFLRYVGISYYTIMRYIALVFGILDVIATYFLAKSLNKSEFFALLSMLFVALSMGDAARTSALVFRGDSFITFFLIMSLVVTLKMFKEINLKRKLILAIIAGAILSLANFVWNGAPFTTVIFLLLFILLLMFGFTFSDRKFFTDAKFMLILFLAWFALVSLYRHTYLIIGQTFTGWHFIPIFIAMLTSIYLLEFIDKQVSSSTSHKKRFAIFIGIFMAAFLLIYALLPNFVMSVIINGSFLSLSPNRFAATIQELQPPHFSFLIASFNLELFLSLMNFGIIASVFSNLKYVFELLIALLAVPYFYIPIFDAEGLAKGRARIMFSYNEPLLALLAYFLTTAYLQINAIRFNSLVSVPLAIFAAYTIFWLIKYAENDELKIRQNAFAIFEVGSLLVLFAILLAVLAVNKFNIKALSPLFYFPIFTLITLLAYYNMQQEERSANTITSLILIFIIANVLGIQAYMSLSYVFQGLNIEAETYGALSLIVGLLIALFGGWLTKNLIERKKKVRSFLILGLVYILVQSPLVASYLKNDYLEVSFAWYIIFLIFGFILAYYVYIKHDNWYMFPIFAITSMLFFSAIIATNNMSPADFICNPSLFCYNPRNPPVVQALAWLKNNSPVNSVVLTLWPDGSLVEGIANRTSVTDSVGSQNISKADPFAMWLLSSQDDPGFLLSPINGKPNYLLTRYVWLEAEEGGIYTESGYNITTYNQTEVNELKELESQKLFGTTNLALLNKTETNTLDQAVNNEIESLYGMTQFTKIGENINATQSTFTFSGIENYTAIVKIVDVNNTKEIGGYLIEGKNVSLLYSIIFYNIYNTNFSIINQASVKGENISPLSLLIVYSPVPRKILPVNITTVALVSPGLLESNMFKFLYECGYQGCLWNNKIADLKLVYNNLDTKIFEIQYNESNATVAATHYS